MTKYQYTYFIYPYTIEESKYNKYLLKLLRDKKCEYKFFEKEKDLDIYNFFLPTIRSYLFPTFELRGEGLRDFNLMRDEDKLRSITKNHVNYFNYNLAQDVQGKVGEENGVFFKVEGIELICFDTGICFFTMKTHIENTNKLTTIDDIKVFENPDDILDNSFDLSGLTQISYINLSNNTYNNIRNIINNSKSEWISIDADDLVISEEDLLQIDTSEQKEKNGI